MLKFSAVMPVLEHYCNVLHNLVLSKTLVEVLVLMMMMMMVVLVVVVVVAIGFMNIHKSSVNIYR